MNFHQPVPLAWCPLASQQKEVYNTKPKKVFKRHLDVASHSLISIWDTNSSQKGLSPIIHLAFDAINPGLMLETKKLE